MKGQDILLLLKFISLAKQARLASQAVHEAETIYREASTAYGDNWQGWDITDDTNPLAPNESLQEDCYSLRQLSGSTGISKSEVSASLQRSKLVGLITEDRKTSKPKVNTRTLLRFIEHGLKLVFPAQPNAITRGIPTSFAEPVMENQLMTAGEYIYVWPDPTGNISGQAVAPLFKSVPKAVKQDPHLYAMLALVDAVRLGRPRESQLAIELLEKEFTR